jgi:hypothetical protein
MRIASPTHLASRLDRSLAWRKKELTQLKFTADAAPTAVAAVLRRSGLALMYAHWEGFIKDASEFYLRYLADSLQDVGKLKSCFVAIALNDDIRVYGPAKAISVQSKLVEVLRSLDQPPSMMKRLRSKGVISTRSNLKGEVLREITATLGIDYSRFELKEKPVIDRLVQFRNSIAHGDGRPVSQGDYADLHTEIILLMDAYKDLIQDAASNNRHLR